MKPERIQSQILDLLDWKDSSDPAARARLRQLIEDETCSSLMLGVAKPWGSDAQPTNGSVAPAAPAGGPDPFEVVFEGVGLFYEHPVMTTLLWALMRDREALWGSQVGGLLKVG